MSVQSRQVYAFGPFRLDPGLSRLEREGTAIPIAPKAFDLLVLLANSPDRLLSKAELMEALWPSTFVEDANLTQHVYTLRKALGDRPDGEPYIETVPRRGYRLNADVRPINADAAAATPRATRTDAAPPSEGERKQATVLHLAIADAATLVERLGPEGLDETLARVAGIVGTEVGRYEGILRRREAGEFVALFGARIVHEDDARRAVLAALAIIMRLDEQVRVGIDSGAVVVSHRPGDRGVDYSAVGETMRVADLLQQMAEPGTILISEATRRASEGYVRVEPAPAETRAAGGPAFRVVGLAPDASMRAPRPKRMLSVFVGRHHESRLLADLAAVALDGKGQVANVVGEPGMGKSRLVHEFTQAIAADRRPVMLEGRCVSYGSLVPYLPLADLIRAYCGIEEGATADEMRLAIGRAVEGADLPANLGPWLLRLLGVVDDASALDALSPEALKARTFDVLRSLFLKASTRRPLVIVVEDVHWIDRTSEEFLTTLIERVMGSRIMLVVTFRPGYRAPWMDRSYVSHVTLAPLQAADGARLLESVDVEHRLSPDTSAVILARAEGNPFFLEELARTVSEHGPESIPNTVHGVIMARLDRLTDSAKRLLQTASVVGREVPLGLLKRVWAGGDDFEAELVELSRLEFLFERPEGDEPVYVFKHALTQDVAYDSLLARRRRELHLKAAQVLQDMHAGRLDEIAATLAYHYARTELDDDAVAWLMRAADQAARVYANAEAILHLDLARRRLERLPEGATRERRAIDVALRYAHSLYFLGRFTDSIETLQPHGARLARLNDPALTAASVFWLAHMYSRVGDQRRAAESAQAAIDAATLAGDEATLGKAHGVLALEGHWSGNTANAIAHGKTAIRLLHGKADQRWWLGMAHFYVAMNHLLTGHFEAALTEAACADAVGREISDPRLQTYAGFTSGWAEASRGNCDLAIHLCRRSRDQAPDRVSRAYASMILGYVRLEAGEQAEARALLEPTAAELESFGFPQWHAWALILVSETLRIDGLLDRAAACVASGLDVGARAQYWYGVGFGERVLARIARDRGCPAESAASFDRALRTFERIGAAFEAARTRADAAGRLEKEKAR